MQNTLAYILLIIGVSFVIASCEEACMDATNPSCDNYDPCHNAIIPEDNEIVIEEWMDGIQNTEEEKIPYCDTVLAHPRNTVAMRTENEWKSYSWKVGTDTRTFTEREVTLSFGNAEPRVDIQVQIEEKGPHNCLNTSDGIVSLSKNMIVIPMNQSKMIGSYQGSLESNPQDTFTVRISVHPDPFGGPIYTYNIYNIPKGCEDIYDHMDNIAGYASLRFNADGEPAPSCNNVTGYAYLEANRRDIVIPFAIDIVGTGRKSYIFKGTRL